MNSFILDSRPKPVNLLLGTLDEKFEWGASKNLHRRPKLLCLLHKCQVRRLDRDRLKCFPGKELLLILYALLP